MRFVVNVNAIALICLWCAGNAFGASSTRLAEATTPAAAAAAGGAPPSPPPPSSKKKAPGERKATPTGSRVKAPPRDGPVELYSINTRETLMLRLRDDKGRPLRGLQKRFDKFLRCHHTNAARPMNPRLVRVLYQVGRHFPGRRVEVVSGYRHPSVAKNPRSPHMQGQACDFRIAGIKNGDLRDYLRRDFQKVGVGYYPNSTFVHLDVRKDKSAFWIDYSGPGDRAVYSVAPGIDLKTGRAEAYKPTRIEESWIHQPDPPPPQGKHEGKHEEGDDDAPLVGSGKIALPTDAPPSSLSQD